MATLTEIVDALRTLTVETGCGDPDCCEAAKKHKAAVVQGKVVLAKIDVEGVNMRVVS